MEKPELSRYSDYRLYLKDFYKVKQWETRSHLRPYTYSDFSAAADIRSPNYLKLIMEGKRNLSSEMAKKFARALKLQRRQVKEFELLVEYNQEKDTLLRNRHLKNLSELRAKDAVKSGQISSKAYNQVSSWLMWVLYAMVDQQGVRFKPSSLREALGGLVNEAQINDALKKLVDSGKIEVDELSGFAMKKTSSPKDEEKIPAELVRKIQSELIYLGLEALHRYGPTEREVSGVTLAMTQKEYEWVRFELRKLRKQVQTEIQTNRSEELGERVYQFNVQLFPITEPVKSKKKSLEDSVHLK